MVYELPHMRHIEECALLASFTILLIRRFRAPQHTHWCRYATTLYATPLIRHIFIFFEDIAADRYTSITYIIRKHAAAAPFRRAAPLPFSIRLLITFIDYYHYFMRRHDMQEDILLMHDMMPHAMKMRYAWEHWDMPLMSTFSRFAAWIYQYAYTWLIFHWDDIFSSSATLGTYTFLLFSSHLH